MDPFEHGLYIEPALPQGFPARRTAPRAVQIAAIASNRVPTLLGGQLGRGDLGQEGYQLDHILRQDLARRLLWALACRRTQLQEPHGRGGQQAQQTAQALVALQLASLDAAARFEPLMIVLDDPARPIPLDALPGLLQRR